MLLLWSNIFIQFYRSRLHQTKNDNIETDNFYLKISPLQNVAFENNTRGKNLLAILVQYQRFNHCAVLKLKVYTFYILFRL